MKGSRASGWEATRQGITGPTARRKRVDPRDQPCGFFVCFRTPESIPEKIPRRSRVSWLGLDLRNSRMSLFSYLGQVCRLNYGEDQDLPNLWPGKHSPG